MDFVRLGPAYSTDYVPDMLIEGYSSLIWTERFQEPSEFELRTFDIEGFKAILPEDTLVSHLETQEVMTVETHEIQMVGEGEAGQPELIIRGRSSSIIFEHRWVESAYQKKRRLRKAYSATSAIAVLLYNAVVNSSGADLTRGDDDPDTEDAVNHYTWTTLDVIPNVVITEAVANEGSTRWWQVQEGELYSQIKNILIDSDLGLRCLRPVSPSPATVVTVHSALSTRGTVVRTDSADVTQLRFEIYGGIDRSATVQFSLLQGHIDKPSYLTSSREHKTVAEVMSTEISVADVYRPGESGLTGWRRKTMGFDGGDPELPALPEKPDELRSNATAAQRRARRVAMDKYLDRRAKVKNKRSAIIADFKAEQTAAAQVELKKHRRLDMFSGDISSLSPYTYKLHYDLGDTVMLFGDYGKVAPMVVSEYVRTEDTNGDRGFPGLVAP